MAISNTSKTKDFLDAGYGQGAIGIGDKVAVLVVDFQKAFTCNSSPIGGNPLILSALQCTSELISIVRNRDIPIIYTVVAYDENKMDIGLWPKKVPILSQILIGSKWAELDESLEVKKADTVIVKKMPSAFFNTNLTNILIRNQIDTIIITGCTTSGCIRATAIDSFSYGFRTIIAKDCVGDQNLESHSANLFDIHNRYGDILTNDEIKQAIEKNK